MHTFCDHAPGSHCHVPHDRTGRRTRAVDPVIVVGAGPVGLTLSLALAAQGVPSVLLDEGPGTEEVRLA
ncbi:FAD-dependent monooxygenase, partial [Streptomyces sp. NRRL WC-3725]|uniref:FAD-dependent monooxygenase n=1 Tax=Streptomyces sp. NRRL WC-3725 TaxID=1463933 RepID=UPI001F1C09AC